jgi:glycosyltransferase involved in cell wall biosynthesis
MLGNRNGGIGRYVLELAKHILAIDVQNQYVIFVNHKNTDESDIQQLRQFNNVTIVSANIRHYSLGEQLSFHRLLKKHNLDLVHFPNFNVPLLYDRPFVVTIHDLVHHKISGHKKSHFIQFEAYKKIIQSAADRSRAIITVSEASKKDIMSLLAQKSRKVEVIYEGPTLEAKVAQHNVDDAKRKYLLGRPFFLFVGVLERKKNVVNLTRGFDVFLKKYGLDMDLVIAGKPDKHYPDIKHHALDIKFNDHLVFTDYIEDSDLAALYKSAYAFVSASLHEGFGLPGVEAMRFGLPLAVSNTPVFNEVYDNAAIYFDPLQPDDIAEKLHLLATEIGYYKQLQVRSLERAKLFDWKVTAEKTLEVYRSCALH